MPKIDDDVVIGFLDEASPQTTANTQRLWSFRKPILYKNTTKIRANTFGFYSINGNAVIDFKDYSNKESVCDFLVKIREKNPNGRIVIILDNFRSHKAKATLQCANDLGIELIFLPPYSPDLNPIEFIWKSIKRVISPRFIIDIEHMKAIIGEKFLEFSSSISFARGWVDTFLGDKFCIKC